MLPLSSPVQKLLMAGLSQWKIITKKAALAKLCVQQYLGSLTSMFISCRCQECLKETGNLVELLSMFGVSARHIIAAVKYTLMH